MWGDSDDALALAVFGSVKSGPDVRSRGIAEVGEAEPGQVRAGLGEEVVDDEVSGEADEVAGGDGEGERGEGAVEVGGVDFIGWLLVKGQFGDKERQKEGGISLLVVTSTWGCASAHSHTASSLNFLAPPYASTGSSAEISSLVIGFQSAASKINK